jgi:hypothetical protein
MAKNAPNAYIVQSLTAIGAMKEIPLTNGGVTSVDDDAYDALVAFRWRRNPYGYATRSVKRNGKCITILMHRELIGASAGTRVDHKDRNPLNNTRSNLRIATASQNGMNRNPNRTSKSGFKGVRFRPERRKKWVAHIRLDGKDHDLGRFETPEEAARVYDTAARRLFGEFARTNFDT